MFNIAKSLQQGSTCPVLQPGTLRLYNMRFCPYAQRIKLILVAKNLPHETVNIHLKNKPDWFVKKSIFAKVPTLEIDNKIIVESAIIADYLDDVYPENKMNSLDPYERAWDRILLELFGKVEVSFYRFIMLKEEPNQTSLTLTETMQEFENHLIKRQTVFFGGNKPGFLDYMIWPWFERLPASQSVVGYDLSLPGDKFPKMTAWQQAMSTDGAVQHCRYAQDLHEVYLSAYQRGAADFDLGLTNAEA